MNLLDMPPSLRGETQPVGSPVQPAPASTKEELIRGDFKVWVLLLIIICVAGLGSLSLSIPLSTTSSTHAPTSAPHAYTDGACSAKPTDIQYLTSTTAPASINSSILATWSQMGKTQQDLDAVRACAASFTLRYEGYTSEDLKSLEASVPMLSAAAKRRFYTPDTQALINRMDPMWQANIQKQHVVRTAQVQQPSVISVQNTNGRILVWVTVPYALTIQTNGDTYPSNNALTVLLVNAPSSLILGTGWQVSDWNETPGPFQPAYPL